MDHVLICRDNNLNYHTLQSPDLTWNIVVRAAKTHLKLDGCIVWNAHNTVFVLKRSAKQFTSCI